MIDKNIIHHIQAVEDTRTIIERWTRGQDWKGLSYREVFGKISNFANHRLITNLDRESVSEIVKCIAEDVVKPSVREEIEVTLEERVFISDFAADTFKILLKESMKENILSNGLYERLSKEAYEAAKIFYQVRKENLKDAV